MKKTFLLLLAVWIGFGAGSGFASSVIYSYTGTTAANDSTITAWFQFDSTAMSDGLVFWYEIPQHSFLVSGNRTSMNGQYDRFLGGAIEFSISAPGPHNLPTFQSLVIQDSSTGYFVQSDALGDPSVFIGGPDGIGNVYHGGWSFGLIPEPSSAVLFAAGSALFLMARRRSGVQPGAFRTVGSHLGKFILRRKDVSSRRLSLRPEMGRGYGGHF